MSVNLQGSRNVPCSSYLTECFQPRSSLVFSSQNCLTSQGSLVSLACQRSNLVLPIIFLFFFSPMPSKISGRDPLIVVECCNTPRPLRQVSSSYSLLLPCHLFACHAFHIIASCALHHASSPYNCCVCLI